MAVSGERKDRRLSAPWIVAAVAAAVRLLFLWETHRNPEFSILAIDARFYVRMAERFAAGDFLLGEEPLWYGPLYPVVMGVLFRVFGADPTWMRLVQHALGVVTAAAVTAICLRWGRPAAWIAGLLTALSPVAIFYESQLLMVTFALAATTAFLGFLLPALREGRAGAGFAAGLAHGVLALIRTNAILFAPVALAILFATRRVRAGVLFALGIALVLTPLLLRNGLVAGAWTPLTVNGGMIFATGFADEAVGGRAFVRTPEDFGPRGAYQREAEAAAGRPLSLAEASDVHRDAAVRRILDDPAWAARLTLRKAALLFSAAELDDNLGFEFFRGRSRVLQWLPSPWMPLTILGLFGAVLAFGDRSAGREPRVVAAFAATYAVSLLLAFVNARYRLPLTIPAALLAAYAVRRTADLARAGRRQRLAIAGAAGLAGALLVLHDPGVTPDRAIQFSSFGAALLEAGHPREALRATSDALSVDPMLPGAHLNQALAWMALGRSDEALTAAVRARELEPDLFDAWQTEGALRAQAGDVEGALPAFERAASLRPEDPGALLNLAQALWVLGRADEAIDWGTRAAARGQQRAAALVEGWRRETEAGSRSPQADRAP